MVLREENNFSNRESLEQALWDFRRVLGALWAKTRENSEARARADKFSGLKREEISKGERKNLP